LWYAKGTAKQNRVYCTKEGKDIFEHGEVAGQGERTDLTEATTALKRKRLEEVAEEFPETFVKYHKGLTALKAVYDNKELGDKNRDMEVILLYGEAGTGKTREAQEEGRKRGRVYILPPPNNGSTWWDGYEGQETVILDDFYGWLKPHDLFRYLDIYPLKLAIKGGTVAAQYTRVYITSNNNSDDWYKEGVRYNKEALERRIHKKAQFMKDPKDGSVLRVVEKDQPPTVITV